MESIANVARLGYVGSKVRKHIDSENDDWYTPMVWLKLARTVFGNGIDLDPFSSPMANERVNAKQFFTQQDNAFEQSWIAGSVWMNPPYTRGLVDKACDKFLEQYELGNFNRGLVLVNNMTDTQWYRRMDNACAMMSNLTRRIAFENAAGQRISGNTRGQTLFLFASNSQRNSSTKSRFKTELKRMGHNVKNGGSL